MGGCAVEYDKYKGVQELLPFARSVSAKSINFDEEGNCIEIDFLKMMKIVKTLGIRVISLLNMRAQATQRWMG